MFENRNFKVLGITGNRPFKFQKEDISPLQETIMKILKDFKFHGGETVLQGGAEGVDQWVALSALQLGLQVKSYLPFPQQDKGWSEESKENLRKIIGESSEVTYEGDHHSNQFYFARNSKIVKNCDVLLAIMDYDCTDGGAYWTYNEATAKKKPTVLIKSKEGKIFKKVSFRNS